MKKISIVLALILTLGVTTTTFAQTSPTAAQLLEQIKTLQAQLQALQSARGQVRSSVSSVQSTLSIIRNLRHGMSGEDVRELQQLLIAEGVYPEAVVSGYYGALTSKAVRAFQNKHGIEQVGEVGPKTRAILHGLKSRGIMFSTTTGTSTVGVGANNSQVTICHYPPGNPANRQTITVGAPAVAAHLKHGDSMGACHGTGGGSTTTPDTLMPIISQLSASSTGSTSANVAWTTNEPATSLVLYGTSTPVTYANSHAASMGGLTTNHLVSLSSLTASSTYRFVVVSADAAGNTATSSESSFLTP